MQPLVSVRVVTYNHEKYIGKCIEGILMQKTDFPFEVIIGEDCSTDKTREIVFDYMNRYKDIIKVITSDKNVGGQQNSMRVHKACSGKYHAICEGDDYWIDPLKLQKQVNFLEARPDYTMCFHDALCVWEDKAFPPSYFCPGNLNDTVTIDEVISRSWFIPTASIMARSHILDSLPEWRKNVWCGDLLVRLWCAHHGKIGYINEIMSVYRKHNEGFTSKFGFDVEYGHTIVKYLYREFDKETGYRYTELLKKAIKLYDDHYKIVKLRKKLGLLSFIIRPDLTLLTIIRRLRSDNR